MTTTTAPPSPFITNADERVNTLMQPGVLRALRGVSIDSFETLQRRIMNEAAAESNATTNPHTRLLAHMIREFNADPVLLKIEPIKLNPSMSAMEKRRAKEGSTPWNALKKILGSLIITKEDWQSVFKIMANAIETQEREHGLELAQSALRRSDSCIEMIEQFPRIFRSGRGNENTQTALWSLASGIGSTDFSLMEIKRQEPGFAAKEMAKVIEALQATKIKETGSSLIAAAMSTKEVVRDAFFAVYGKESVLKAADNQGYTALHTLATQAGMVERMDLLIEMGAPLLAEDASHRTPLAVATLIQGNAANVGALLRAKAYTPEILDRLAENANKGKGYMPDPQVRALILAEKARASIDAMDIPALRRDAPCA
jgi:hypothetical protein